VEAAIGLCLPVLKRRRHLYVFGPCDLTKLPVSKPATLIWDKGRTSLGGQRHWVTAHEPIQFATAHYSKAEMEQGRGGLSARLRQGSVIREMRLDGTKIRHPTEKPLALMKCLIESSSLAGEVVLDPFAGSGSTLVAAVLAGRRALGVELDKEYADLAVARVKQAEAVAASMEGL
jgi:site-specific DNA-methyltransferase (adenine-specific)